MFRDDSFKSVKISDFGRAFNVNPKLAQLVGKLAFDISDAAVKYLSKMRGFDCNILNYNFSSESFDFDCLEFTFDIGFKYNFPGSDDINLINESMGSWVGYINKTVKSDSFDLLRICLRNAGEKFQFVFAFRYLF